MAKKKPALRQKKRMPIKSVTLAEQNPAAVDIESLKRTLTKQARKKQK